MNIHTANPIRVAIEELQLHDLQNIEAAANVRRQLLGFEDLPRCLPAVDVKQNARPATHEDAMVVRPPANGRDTRAPIVVETHRI